MTLLVYISKTIIIAGLLVGYYWLFLRNKQFHQYNRFYLLSIPFFALCLPLFNIPVPGLSFSNAGAGYKILKVITNIGWQDEVIILAKQNGMSNYITWQNIATAAYILVTALLLYVFTRSLFYIISLRRKYPYEKMEDIRFFQTPEPGTPFSFLKNIFWNSKIEIQSKQGEQVLRHELYHVKQKHSSDILFLEITRIFCWFNPFFHLVKKEIKVIHEFLADQYAASASNRYDYAELLLWQSAGDKQLAVTNHFFHNQIKRRIMMITKFRNTRYGYISRLMALPLLFILFCAFAVKLTNKKPVNNLRAIKTITVAIDAGHGGIDKGTMSSAGIWEKDISLSIAKKIEQLSGNYNVHVVMTRNKDILPGNAVSIKEGLLNRVNIAESNNAAFLISIHTDANLPNSANSGFQIYLSEKNPYYQKSIELGSALTQEIKKTYSILPDLQQRQKAITVLQSSRMPSVMIECGYINNPDDFAFITNEKNQEKIAIDILAGIVQYANNNRNINPIAAIIPEDTTIQTEGKSVKADAALTKVEIESEYPGGQTAWTAYLTKNLVYPKKAINKEIQGTVLMQFIVETDGTLSDIKVLQSPDKALSDETIRIIKNSGKWVPAQQHGRKVRSYKKQPLIFKLERQ